LISVAAVDDRFVLTELREDRGMNGIKNSFLDIPLIPSGFRHPARPLPPPKKERSFRGEIL
jgi:hypothetical protein